MTDYQAGGDHAAPLASGDSGPETVGALHGDPFTAVPEGEPAAEAIPAIAAGAAAAVGERAKKNPAPLLGLLAAVAGAVLVLLKRRKGSDDDNDGLKSRH